MVTSLVSMLTKVPVRADVAMTGEITLRGRVTAIGGLKEKLLAALRGGIRTVIIPEENRKDLADIPANVTRDLEIVPVKWIDEVLDLALERPLAPKKARKSAQRVGAQQGQTEWKRARQALTRAVQWPETRVVAGFPACVGVGPLV
jgi:ATP-dependent Lon protease